MAIAILVAGRGLTGGIFGKFSHLQYISAHYQTLPRELPMSGGGVGRPTHGYTEINFAAFAMLGRRFCPRIRGLKKQRLYRLDATRNYGPLAGLVGRADRTKAIVKM
jgi:TnpA family transposase